MSNFPSSLDNLDPTRGTASQPLSSPSHVDHHQNEDDAIEALQAKIGIDNSAVTTSIDYLLKNASSVSPGHKHVAADLADLLPISSSVGVADASKLVKTDSLGEIDGSFLKAPIVRTYLTAASPATWTRPTGLNYVIVEVQAGGGGGGGNTTSNRGGGGGGGGGYSKKMIPVASLGATETVTIGAGGAGGGAGAGTAGATSSFGSHCSSTGGGAGDSSASISGGGGGGAGSDGDVNITGQSGGSGAFRLGTDALSMGGSGGSSVLGSGATYTIGSTAIGGSNGILYGGGGSGSSNQDGVDTVGGSGAAGIVIVTEYY